MEHRRAWEARLKGRAEPGQRRGGAKDRPWKRAVRAVQGPHMLRVLAQGHGSVDTLCTSTADTSACDMQVRPWRRAVRSRTRCG